MRRIPSVASRQRISLTTSGSVTCDARGVDPKRGSQEGRHAPARKPCACAAQLRFEGQEVAAELGRRPSAADIASKLGLGSTDPSRMSAEDAARLMNYARTEQPEVLKKTVEEKPWFVKAMGNPVVMGALAVAAAKMLSSHRSKTAG